MAGAQQIDGERNKAPAARVDLHPERPDPDQADQTPQDAEPQCPCRGDQDQRDDHRDRPGEGGEVGEGFGCHGRGIAGRRGGVEGRGGKRTFRYSARGGKRHCRKWAV